MTSTDGRVAAAVDRLREGKLTPLGIIGLFLGLTEAIAGLAVINSSGAVQMVLALFVVAFPVLVLACFMLTLWHRPYVLYPPGDYGKETDVGRFVEAMQRRPLAAGHLYAEIQAAVKGEITADRLAQEIGTALRDRKTVVTVDDVKGLLGEAARATMERVREVGFVTVYAGKLGESDTQPLQLPYHLYTDVQSLLDEAFISLYQLRPGFAEPYTYGAAWWLADRDTGRRIDWHGRGPDSKDVFVRDKRPLSSENIYPGTELEVFIDASSGKQALDK